MDGKYDIVHYKTPDGRIVFQEWFDSLKSVQVQWKISARLDRLRMENLGHWRSVGSGVFELKIDFGPGFRVYFGRVGNNLILLLCGGDKRSQKQDIKRAKEYWMEYRRGS